MNIRRLEIKNCLGISELEVKAGQINLIQGGTEKGKSSVLESIEKALRNTQRRAQFVRDGEQVGTLYVELDDGTELTRRVYADGQASIDLRQNGGKVAKPETYLKSLVGDFSFNPVDFLNLKEKPQTEILLSLIPMRVTEQDLQEWFGEIPAVNLNQHAIDVLAYLAEKYFYDRRTIANSEVRECANEIRALHEQLPDNYDGAAWREVNIGELWNQVREGEKVNQYRQQAQDAIDTAEEKIAAIENKYRVQKHERTELFELRVKKAHDSVQEQRDSIQTSINTKEAEILRLQEEIKELQRQAQAIDESVIPAKVEALKAEHTAEIKALSEKEDEEVLAVQKRAANATVYLTDYPPVDVEPLKQTAEQAERMKGFIPLWENKVRLETDLQKKQFNASHLDECVQIARNKPAELLQGIKLPVDGLGINADMQLVIHGRPITNLSTSQSIKLAVDIARATCGPLKLICVDRFESLDAEKREAFLKEIENDGYQYFITQVTSGPLAVDTVGV